MFLLNDSATKYSIDNINVVLKPILFENENFKALGDIVVPLNQVKFSDKDGHDESSYATGANPQITFIDHTATAQNNQMSLKDIYVNIEQPNFPTMILNGAIGARRI